MTLLPASQSIAGDAPKGLQSSMKTSLFTIFSVLGSSACAVANAAASAAMMVAAVTTNESSSVGTGAFCLLFPVGSGACAVPPSDASYGSNLCMLQTDFLETTNRTGGATTATARPGSPHNDLYSDLLRGSGGESVISIPPFVGALGRASAQPFPIRYGSALRTGGGCSGGGGSFCLPLIPTSDVYVAAC